MIHTRYGRLTALAFLAGAALGALTWSHLEHEYRRDLFSRHPLRRFAALGYLRIRPSVETARLLRDYVAWERNPLLRHRGRTLARRVEKSLT